ncbi:lysophospholipid acyltransferase family protein [Emcibacter sp. SYSU 3D8]|uniref:lysophospholipid acyltransferase family protein n=1 Tax=Emcibacter sp. SYSU 3D8 TaxID=3133969 RepID=UPI0031FEC6B3
MADGSPTRARSLPLSHPRALLCLLGVALCLVPVILIQPILLRLPGRAKEKLPYWYFKVACWILGISVEVHGERSREEPVLYVANHVSWLDIFTLGGLMTPSFVARGDLEGWALFGWLSTLRRTIFIDRENRTRSSAHLEMMIDRLRAGDSLILFPEGTSSDGSRVLPFKSSLFAVAERWQGAKPLTVQPVTVAYTQINSMPLGRHFRPFVGWYGDMVLGPHVWELLTIGRVSAVITFHDAITLDAVGGRKAMSAHCHAEISRRLEYLNSGYDPVEHAA